VLKERVDGDTQITYVSLEGVRMDFPAKRTSLILTLEDGKPKAYMLNHDERTYSDLSSMASTLGSMYFAMFVRCESGGGNCDVDTSAIKPTDEYKVINGRRARKVIYYTRNLKYLLGANAQAIPDSIENWFVRDWRPLVMAEMTRMRFLSEYSSRALNSPEVKGILRRLEDYLSGVFSKYGAPISTVSPFMGRVLRTTRFYAARADIPEDKFGIPEGYRRK